MFRFLCVDCKLVLALALLCFLPPASAARIINLGLDEATAFKYQQPIDTVFIANPDIADYQVVKDNQLIVFGKQVGSTSLLVMDADGKIIASRTLVINKSLANVRQQIAARFPDSNIEMINLGDQVVLSGTVPSEQVREDIYRLVGELLGKDYEDYKFNWKVHEQELEIDFMTRRRFKGLVNNIEVAEVKQLNVKLTIAEVSHSFIRQLGFKWGSITSDGVFIGNGQFAGLIGSDFSKNIIRFISAVDDDSMGKILAEPNLSVISGETASFLAGGEMPIVTKIDDTYVVSYKEFGVRLELAAKVLKDNKIKLTMQPEVSAIDVQNRNETLDIPAFKTRRARTTIQLADGDSFVLGGLLNSEDREALSKIPLIGDIPILGSLFRHSQNERHKTELIIVATVNLVKAVPQDKIQIPKIVRDYSLLRYFALDFRTPSSVKDLANNILATGGFKE